MARMLARRILRMRDDLSLEMSLSDLMNHHLDHHFGGEDMKQTRQGILTILDGEEKRYQEMLRKGEQVVKTQLKDIAADTSQIPDEILFNLNDSHGLAPDMAVSFLHNDSAGLKQDCELVSWPKWQKGMPLRPKKPRRRSDKCIRSPYQNCQKPNHCITRML